MIRVLPPWDLWGSELEPWILKARETLDGMANETSGVRFFIASGLALQIDDRDASFDRTPQIMVATVFGMVIFFSLVAFRSLVLGPRLLLTIILTISTVFGSAVVWMHTFGYGGGSEGGGLFWMVPVVCTPVLVGQWHALCCCYSLPTQGIWLFHGQHRKTKWGHACYVLYGHTQQGSGV